ncbi:ATP-dependent DNA ligase [Streptomyces sp. NPDC001978]|uniref:ATP-dependent DNA ligase n=1 Tax=Streptomyces sp. NPDC001978 TaxID=3364627 RepID=UPI00368E065E
MWERDRLAFELQQRLAGLGTAAAQAAREWPAHFVAFDLVHRDTDLTGWPYARRRAALEALFAGRGLTAPWVLCPSTTDPAVAQAVVGLDGGRGGGALSSWTSPIAGAFGRGGSTRCGSPSRQ